MKFGFPKNNFRVFIGAFLAPVLLFSSIFPLAIYFGPVVGDLTRIGRWPERDYIATKAQPTLAIRPNPSITSAEILVLGDSFSQENLWQSALYEKTGLSIVSFDHTSGCVSNWIDQLVSKAIKTDANILVIEIVEREYLRFFLNFYKCKNTKQLLPFQDALRKPNSSWWQLTLDAEYVFGTAKHTIALARDPEKTFKEDAVNAPLKNRGAFSNNRADRLLYYFEDRAKTKWTAQQIESAAMNALQVKNRLKERGVELVVLVVPDKSSVYEDLIEHDPPASKANEIWRSLSNKGVITLELLKEFKQARSEVVDLYKPNDTHLSASGSMLMAHYIAELPLVVQVSKPNLKN